MSKFLCAFLFVFSAVAFAQNNNSTTCRHEAYRYMSEMEAYSFCQNVASNCFDAFFRNSGLDGARNTCNNVSSSCFSKAAKIATNQEAATICLDVNNNCFSAYYPELKDVSATVKKCSN